ncbi:MAG: hypothetical protein J07HN4v3_02087 [Halonotius sp. J07HN4]|nr:MAG: hypothetical protein J07HN4v3_02087 [Halonotius sp. J07HN4]
MPIGIVDKEALANAVAAALSDWTATQAYDQESGFRDDLYTYLNARINAGGDKTLDTGGNFVVDRTYDDIVCDVVVSDTVGIAVYRDLTASRISNLHEQMPESLNSYTHVVIIACGSVDEAAWEQLRDFYGDQQGMNNDPGSTPVMFLRRYEANYGRGDRAENYESDTSKTKTSLFTTIQTVMHKGLRKLRSQR